MAGWPIGPGHKGSHPRCRRGLERIVSLPHAASRTRRATVLPRLQPQLANLVGREHVPRLQAMGERARGVIACFAVGIWLGVDLR